MKRLVILGALLAAVVAAVFSARADAILFGTPDGNDHRGVGYIVFYDSGNVPIQRCSGSLVSTRVVLTVGHCAGTFDNGSGPRTPVLAQIWFEKQIREKGRHAYPGGGVSCTGFKGWPCTGGDSYGVPVAHPEYEGSFEGVVNDIGVVLLEKRQNNRRVLDLASVETLEKTAPGSPMTIVGFGTQSETPPPDDHRQRMRGEITFLRTEDGSQEFDDPTFADFTNASPGAAACVGDSGGPVLNADGEIVAIMTIIDPYIDGWCQGIGYHYRTDTLDSKEFLAGFGVRVGGSGKHKGDGHHKGKHGRDLNEDDRYRNDH